jgi:hypothetical protein
MIVGADVTHVEKGSESGLPSMAGLVATYDIDSGRYLASARLQTGNVEVMSFKIQGCVSYLHIN